jgi:hypothetical protein
MKVVKIVSNKIQQKIKPYAMIMLEKHSRTYCIPVIPTLWSVRHDNCNLRAIWTA